MYIKKILPFVFALFIMPCVINAQVTTGNLTGTVKTAAGSSILAGASVEVKHEPTGTIYTAVTRKDGRYDIPDINGGGPYTIKATYVGFQPDVKSEVFVTIGETQNISFLLKDAKATATAITVVGAKVAVAAKNGSETTIGRDKLTNGPSVGRNLSDFVRFTPQVKIGGDGGISVAGQNNRFNSFSIDGATNNDVFGLSATGTNGGQAGTPPISIDAIDQIVVKISDFDASIGNYTGGSINATTRSGSNNINGSVYAFYRNQATTGRAPIQTLVPGSLTKYEYAKAPKFENKTFGFRIGGPIIKNKLFYFINAERQQDQRPQPFDPSSYRGSALADGSLTALTNYLKSSFNYDPGEYANNPDLIDRININTRFDWNINKKNKLLASFRITDVERVNPGRSSAGAIQFYTGAQLFPSITKSGSVELNTKFNNRNSNKLRLTATNVFDNRGYTGNPFPAVQIFDGANASIFFGSEAASTGNVLEQNIVNLFDIYKKFVGKHTLSAGFDIDFNKTYNLFINRGFGSYLFANVDSFIQNKTPNRYRVGYSLVDNGKAGDDAVNSAAKFNSARFGFFVNDDIKVNDNFTITLGLRADRFQFLDEAPVDKFWRDSAQSQIKAAGYDIEGAVAGKLPQPRFMLSPRFGFKYDVVDEGLTFRGGIGLFTGRTPLVWPGGVYQNTGVTIGGVDINNVNTNYNNGIKFNPDVNTQRNNAQIFGGNPLPSGDLNLIAKDYRVPMNLRTTIAADKKLGNGWVFSFDATFNKNIYETDWQNLAILKSNATTTGPGARDIIIGTTNLQLRPTGATRPYTGIYLIRNTPNKTGYSYIVTAKIDKALNNGLSFNAFYTYGNSFVNNEGTSSVNASNWQFIEKVSNRNTQVRSVSDFSVGHRIQSYISKKFEYAKEKMATTITLVYTGQSGNPVSYVVGGNTIVNDGVNGNDLVYVPKDRTELDAMFSNTALTNNVNGIIYTTAQQKEIFWEFVNANKYLSSRKGQFAERNGGRLPFTHSVDLKIAQDFIFKAGGKNRSFQVALDMFNFTNLLNDNWGRQFFAGNDQITALSWAGLGTGNLPQYRVAPITTPNRPWNFSDGVTPFNNSRWTGQLSLRFNF